jgi:hypothetical protein
MSGKKAEAVGGFSDLKELLILTALLSFAAACEAFRLSAFNDPEVWRHLQIGDWILHQKSWPVHGLFSQADYRPWTDFNWSYDVLAAIAYRLANLSAIPLLLMFFRAGLAVLSFLLAGGWKKFWSATVLSAVAQYLLFDFGPSPRYGTILFFGLVLLLLSEARTTGSSAGLKALPLVFLVWSNFDLGFVYGVALYLLFTAVLIIERLGNLRVSGYAGRVKAPIQLTTALAVGGLCVCATFCNPGGYNAYTAFFNERLSAVNKYLPDSSAMQFREHHHYMVLLLVMMAFLFLGFAHSRDLFLILTLTACAVLSFHSQRDLWAVTLAAVAVTAKVLAQGLEPRRQTAVWRIGTAVSAAAAMAIVFLLWLGIVPKDRGTLLARIARKYPVGAADYLRQTHLDQPLFNTYEWGSFLTWYLPEYPVAIDDRTALYPERDRLGYFKVLFLEASYRDFSEMNRARTLLLSKKDPVADAFRGLGGFRVAYEDEISIVYTHEVNN